MSKTVNFSEKGIVYIVSMNNVSLVHTSYLATAYRMLLEHASAGVKKDIQSFSQFTRILKKDCVFTFTDIYNFNFVVNSHKLYK